MDKLIEIIKKEENEKDLKAYLIANGKKKSYCPISFYKDKIDEINSKKGEDNNDE